MRRNDGKGREEKAKRREGFLATLANDYDIPPELLHGGCFIEMRGRNNVVVRGCRRIIKYSTERVVLKMCRYSLTVTGKRLACLTYFSGAVSVEGIIDTLSFCSGEVRENEV